MKKLLLIITVVGLLILAGCNQKPSEDSVCCEIYGLGAYMEKVNFQYEWTTPEECTVPEGFVGGGREIVHDQYCTFT